MIGLGQFCRLLAIVLAVPLSSTANCLAQEVGVVDLTQIVPRVDLRQPPPRNYEVIGCRGGIHEMHNCDRSTKHAGAGAVRTTLVWLDRSEYAVGDRQKFEVRIENVGSAPIKIPFSPQLADLQPKDPKDPRQKFRYSELWVQLWIEGGEKWSVSTGAAVTLYGTSGHPDTMLTL